MFSQHEHDSVGIIYVLLLGPWAEEKEIRGVADFPFQSSWFTMLGNSEITENRRNQKPFSRHEFLFLLLAIVLLLRVIDIHAYSRLD
ncbi:hypothetical protein FRX31_024927 [Thalictrum thalictroides]|uniref:Uncharacterized protein n=1 Tax=Thalictrum thalictroides TaxID=46969 RepID=A0A7J6VL65_THATH|nr:hypothetical protein FRX31_024927 [Thalictrum thalictroides]